MAPTLEYAFSYSARLKPPLAVGGPYGNRTVFEAIDGRVSGPDFTGEITAAGADWMLIGADGWARLDVRAQMLLDGVPVFAAYHGFLQVNDAVQRWLNDDKATAYEDHYFRTSPRFEASGERFHWLTTNLFVGEGHFLPERTVEYRVHRVT